MDLDHKEIKWNLNNMPLIVKSPLQILKNPTSISVAFGTRCPNVVANLIIKALKFKCVRLSIRVRKLLEIYEEFDIEGFAEAVMSMSHSITVRWLIDCYNSIPYGKLPNMVSKLVNGPTIGHFLGFNGKSRANRMHRKQLYMSTSLFTSALAGDYSTMLTLADNAGVN